VLVRCEQIIKSRLAESGWKEEVRLKCVEIIKREGLDKVDLDEIVEEVTPFARCNLI
jgi:hypothetical protein